MKPTPTQEAFGKYIYANEKEVKEVMKLQLLKNCTLFLVSYINESNHSAIGYCAYKLDTDYLFRQKSISTKTKKFIV